MNILSIPKIKNILVLRGGEIENNISFLNGKELILSLSKYDDKIKVIDIFIDEKNNWFERGIPTDLHKIFSKADFYIDTTNNHNINTDYHEIAKKLFVKQIFDFKNTFLNQLNRENLKKILYQLKIKTPRHYIFRNLNTLTEELKEIWNIFHTPIVIKEINHHNFHKKSILTYSFYDTFKYIREILLNHKIALIEEFEEGKHFSVAIFPNFRNQDIYISTPIENYFIDNKTYKIKDKILEEKYLKDHQHDKKLIHFSEIELKNKLTNLAKNIFESIDFNKYILIDFLIKKEKDNIKDIQVLEIHTNPQIFSDSKMDFILKNLNISLGEIIINEIENKFLNN